MNPELLQEESIISAISDYFYLLQRDYPEKEALKLVGDKYRLQTEIRNLFYRGVASAVKSELRSRRIVSNPISPLLIDGYNVLFTLLNYRLGHFVFLSTDSICRDTGSLFGKVKNESLFYESIEQLIYYLSKFRDIQIMIYLDEPVTKSSLHLDFLQSARKKYNSDIAMYLVHSADKAILSHSQGTIATSDSTIIDGIHLPIFDIPLQIITDLYNASIFDLRKFMGLQNS